MDLTQLEPLFDGLLVGICLFCASLLLVRRRDPGIYLPLALLFLFQGSATLLYLLSAEEVAQASPRLLSRVAMVLAGLLELANPFLFWLYVRGLTSEEDPARVPRLYLHIVPPVLVGLLTLSLLAMPTDLGVGELDPEDPRMERAVLIALAVLLGDLLFKILIAVYLVLIVRRLRTYRSRLKDVFASTENRELTWIWVLSAALAGFWVASVAVSLSIWAGIITETEINASMRGIVSLAMLVLYWVLGLWGVRQRPGLVRAAVIEPAAPVIESQGKSRGKSRGVPAPKYEKSALEPERAARIARKIEAAMVGDLLYREPNLSLWDLSKHIGVSSHYVSQTLNTQLGGSFFDYINRWRVKDAVAQLSDTEETILAIAYDVGFNSRSAFYKAFKRETGKTPSDLRGEAGQGT